MIDRFASVFIPSLGWFHLQPGDPVAELLRDVVKTEESACVATATMKGELEVSE